MKTPSKSTLKEVLTRNALRRLAGSGSFYRGEAYFLEDRIEGLLEHGGAVTAKVEGTHEYRVKLWITEGDLDYSCTCPVGDEGSFCKHCVATGLAWLAGKEGEGKPAWAKKKPGVTMDDVRAWLGKQNREALVEMLIEQALQHDRLREMLLMKAAKGGRKGLDVATFRAAIDNAIATEDFVDWRAAYDYSRGVEDVIESIEGLLKDGWAAEVVDLSEYALAALEDAMNNIDDSGGYTGDFFERLVKLHHDACLKTRPDPEQLARKLFNWELKGGWGAFDDAAETYADVLGKEGLAVYRKLAEAEWARIPKRTGRNDDLGEGSSSRFNITRIMESLARQSEDFDALIAIKARDLSNSFSYLMVAEECKKAKRHDEALEWAEKGLKAFPERVDYRLREFLAEEYHRRKRHIEAMAMIWACFHESPRLEMYQNLKAHADRIGKWPEWREKALAHIRALYEKAQKTPAKTGWSRVEHSQRSILVQIFLWEGHVEDAWREAKEGGCSDNLWMELAKKREEEHPADSLDVYQKQVDQVLAGKNNDAYRDAVKLLRHIKELMVRIGRGGDFPAYLESVRAAHKPKRNFMKMLDKAKW